MRSFLFCSVPRAGFGHELLIRYAHKYSRPQLASSNNNWTWLRFSNPDTSEAVHSLPHPTSLCSCAEGRIRTGDPFLFREMLYQLSYLGDNQPYSCGVGLVCLPPSQSSSNGPNPGISKPPGWPNRTFGQVPRLKQFLPEIVRPNIFKSKCFRAF